MSIMWISTNEKFENSPMFFKFLKKNDTCFFNFTNLKKYFLKEIHESMFSSIFSTKNRVEVEAKHVIEFLEKIKESKNINYNFIPATDKEIKIEITIILSSGVSLSSFKLEFELELKDTECFYNNLTCPLLRTIILLKKNQEDLFKLLTKKDAEIEEYVLEGGVITHKEIKTEIFNKNNFILSAFQNIEDDGLQNLYELYSSPIIENFNNWYSDEQKKCDDKPEKAENKKIKKDFIKKNNVDRRAASTSISQTSVIVKKKKILSPLKNL